jgi:glycosyltransferase involved in cell wall biosynthesis
MRIIACLAVANEARHISDTIRSVKAFVDGYVIVDSLFETNPLPGTHSTDATRAIAERVCAPLPLTYIESTERLDEPAARNRYLAETLDDWILVMDGDEQLYGDHVWIRQLFDLVRSGGRWTGVSIPVYTVAINFNGNAPEMTAWAYAHNPLLSTVGHQARLMFNDRERGLRYAHTPLGIGHVAFDKDGREASEGAVEMNDLFVINHHTRQSFEEYQRDYIWEREAIDRSKT